MWSVNLTVESPKNLPIEWYEEDTLLGEYLRAAGRYQSDDSLKLNLHEYMPHTVQSKVTAAMAQVSDRGREDVLRQATLVGVEYLGKHKELDVEELEV